MNTHRAFWDYDSTAIVSCGHCGWEGPAEDNEDVRFPELVEVRCGGCDAMLLVVPFPTFDETRSAAEAGNERARSALPEMELQETEFQRRRNQPHLSGPCQLPELPGDSIVIAWDQITVDDDQVQVLLHDGTEIWREPAYWESVSRYKEIVAILRSRYGSRLVAVNPTLESTWWLYGDKLGAQGTVRTINDSLSAPSDGDSDR